MRSSNRRIGLFQHFFLLELSGKTNDGTNSVECYSEYFIHAAYSNTRYTWYFVLTHKNHGGLSVVNHQTKQLKGERKADCRSGTCGGSGTLTHVYVISTQFYYMRSHYSGTSPEFLPITPNLNILGIFLGVSRKQLTGNLIRQKTLAGVTKSNGGLKGSLTIPSRK